MRMALGAKGSDIVKLVSRQGLRLVGVGVLLGLVVAFSMIALRLFANEQAKIVRALSVTARHSRP
jgi:ABC-type antimicrobial peptide transport system permease subunit